MKPTVRSISMAFLFVFVLALTACSTGKGSLTQADYQRYLTTINPAFMVTSEEAYQWHVYKDKGGPKEE